MSGTEAHVLTWVVNGMFFCSGLASLICEVVWFKQLQWVLGSSTYAVTVVVACFFGGLACGSALGGRWADRWRRPLRAYAVFELSLAVTSMAICLLLSRWERWVEWMAPWLGAESPSAKLLMLLLALAILLVPTALMGSTLPVLARYLVQEHAHLARRIGVLYAVNTLGGAAGCALVGFWLIDSLGVMRAGLTASVIYAGIGLTALVCSFRTSPASAIPRETQAAAPGTAPAVPDRSAIILIVVFAGMGFASIAYEVLWFRLLICFGLNTVYSFAGMLAIYLVGLVLGTLFCALFLAERKDRHLAYFARLQLGVAAAAMLSLAILGRAQNLLGTFGDIERGLNIHQTMLEATGGTSTFLWLALAVLLLPTTLIGIGFPLAMDLAIQRVTRLGSRLGILYALNTVGGVLGSLVTGLILLPLLGSQMSFTAIVGLNLLLFLVLVVSQAPLRGHRVMWREGALTTACLAAAVAAMGVNYLKAPQTAARGATLLDFRESTDATFAVLAYDTPHSGKFQHLQVNGTAYATNYPPGRRYMSTLGHLPALLHPDPRSCLVIAIGTGTTVGALTLHPATEQIWAVDIARDVFDLAPYFVPLNQRFTESPKVRPVVADGRHFLLCTDARFDVMTFEPPPPTDAGVVNLYSREFYQLAKRRMGRHGIICQWINLRCGPEILPRMLLRTMLAEFAHVSLWIPNRMEGVVVASQDPLAIDVDRLRRRMADGAVHADMAANGLGEPEQLLSTFVAADADLAAWVGDVPIVTDDRPRIEYFRRYSGALARFDAVLAHRRPVERYFIRPIGDTGKLDTCRNVMRHIWYSHEETEDRRFDQAAEDMDKAYHLDPENPYLRYLRDELAGGLFRF